jgi:hypothetical protein
MECWWLIFEKRCDGCAHLEEDDYNEDLKAFLQYIGIPKTLYIQKPNPRR